MKVADSTVNMIIECITTILYSIYSYYKDGNRETLIIIFSMIYLDTFCAKYKMSNLITYMLLGCCFEVVFFRIRCRLNVDPDPAKFFLQLCRDG